VAQVKAGKINREWHDSHRMPKNPSREQRVSWHAEHVAACGCRPVPRGLAAEVKAMEPGKTRRPAHG
jgi:hypothetical protein